MSLSGWIATVSLLPLIAVLIVGDRPLRGWLAAVGETLALVLVGLFLVAIILVEAITQ